MANKNRREPVLKIICIRKKEEKIDGRGKKEKGVPDKCDAVKQKKNKNKKNK